MLKSRNKCNIARNSQSCFRYSITPKIPFLSTSFADNTIFEHFIISMLFYRDISNL